MKENKLIAEFMGLEIEETLNKLQVYARKEKDYIGHKTEFYEPHELLYHTSWDWLMPVVQKIRLEDLDFDVLEIGLPFNDVYDAVVEFINEYNKQEFDEEHQSSVMFGVDNNQEL
tara:strand:- start:178 stop:522 length:345 start_codon:yes stop_codon:yes gene_type:complete